MSDLTEPQLAALRVAADLEGGVAGSPFYFRERLGTRGVVRRLNEKGLLAPNRSEGAGLLWRITDAGRALIAQQAKP